MLPQLSLTIDVARPGWICARTCRLVNRAAVVIYRSVWLNDADAMYADIIATFNERFGLVWREVFTDTSMIFGAGELSVHLARSERPCSEVELERLKEEACRVLEDQRAS